MASLRTPFYKTPLDEYFWNTFYQPQLFHTKQRTELIIILEDKNLHKYERFTTMSTRIHKCSTRSKNLAGGFLTPYFMKIPYITYPLPPLSNFVRTPASFCCLVSLTGQVITPHPLCHFLLNEIMDLLGVSLLRSNA